MVVLQSTQAVLRPLLDFVRLFAESHAEENTPKRQGQKHMQRLLEKLNGLSVDSYSCRQDMEQEFDNIFSDITAADKQMEMATNSILAAYCWAKRWPHVAKMLEVIDGPNDKDTGRLKAVIQAALPHLGSGTLRPRLPSELDKEYERNTSAALLLKTRDLLGGQSHAEQAVPTADVTSVTRAGLAAKEKAAADISADAQDGNDKQPLPASPSQNKSGPRHTQPQAASGATALATSAALAAVQAASEHQDPSGPSAGVVDSPARKETAALKGAKNKEQSAKKRSVARPAATDGQPKKKRGRPSNAELALRQKVAAPDATANGDDAADVGNAGREEGDTHVAEPVDPPKQPEGNPSPARKASKAAKASPPGKPLVLAEDKVEYRGHVLGLRKLLAKRQQIAIQQLRITLSGVTAQIAKAKSSLPVFQQAASLASSEDGRASMMRECTAISNLLTSLRADEHNLMVKIEQAPENFRSTFCQQLWEDISGQDDTRLLMEAELPM